MTDYSLTKNCAQCGAIIHKPSNESMKNWINRHKVCSLKCRYKTQKGKKLSEETGKRMSLARTGEKNWAWKGNGVGYHALHKWVQRKLGSPDTCRKCGKSDLKGVLIHWANISGEYKRDITDWIRLCVWCHLEFDGTSIELQKKNMSI